MGYTVISMTSTELHVIVDYPDLYSISKDGNSNLVIEIINNNLLVSEDGEQIRLYKLEGETMP